MTQSEFNDFLEQCYARGFTNVLVGANRSPLPLEEWHPYGAFGGSNPGIEEHISGFTWISADSATDCTLEEQRRNPTAVHGVWTFAREDRDEVLEEQESNYNRMIGESLRRY